jgi:hypothetical protein
MEPDKHVSLGAQSRRVYKTLHRLCMSVHFPEARLCIMLDAEGSRMKSR